MANSLSHILPYPIRNARFTLQLAFRVAAGTPTDPTTPDTEFSSDGGASFADCAEEITTGGSNGMGYLTITGAETNNNVVAIAAKSANCVTSPAILYPRILAIVGSGTLSAGSSGGGTLGSVLAYDVTGCFIRTTGGTGGGGTGGANNQARKIETYTPSTGAFTITPNWETTPDATTTYDVLLPEGVTLGMLRTLNPTTAGNTLDVAATGEAGLDFNNIKDASGSHTLTNITVPAVTGVTNRVTANTDQIEGSDATNQIRDSILSDATRFAGANIDASINAVGLAVVTRAVPGDAMTLTSGERTAIIAALDAAVLEGTITHADAWRICLAADAAVTTGMSGTTGHIRNIADTKDRVAATLDGAGNRTAITALDGTL